MSATDVEVKAALYRYGFGTAEFDEARFELRVAGLAVDVQRKPLEVLAILLARAGEVVTREELHEAVWDGRPTAENVLANAINKLRSALGDQGADLIVTQPRVGYRLVGAVTRAAVGRVLASQLQLAKGDTVPSRPNFVLQELLGASPNFEVWTAQHSKTKELRVYKFALNGSRLSGLKREATLFRVLHDELGPRQDLVSVLDWNFAAAPFFLESEYGGSNLSVWAATAPHLAQMSRAERLALFLQIADGVAAAHSVGVLHKDLKPANVLIAPQRGGGWQIKLTDFGSGRLLEPDRLAGMGITQLGFTMTAAVSPDTSGTPLYLAPELIAQQAPTVKTDLYALGMMLYQLLVGDLKKPMVSGWQRDIEDELLCEDIAAATDGSPQLRPNSVAEFCERLHRLEQRRALRERQRLAEAAAAAWQEAAHRSRTRRPWILSTVAVLAVGLITSTVFFYRSWVSERELARQKEVAEQLNDFLIKDFIGAANPARSGRVGLTVVDAARTAAKNIDARFQSDEVRGALHAAMLEALTGLGQNTDAVLEGQKSLAAYGKAQYHDSARLDAIRTTIIQRLITSSRDAEADAMLEELEGRAAAKDAPLALRVRALALRGVYLSGQQRGPEATAKLEAAYQLAQQLPEASQLLRDWVEASLVIRYNTNNELQKAETLVRMIMQRQPSGMSSRLALLQLRVMLGRNLSYQNRFAEAERELTQALAELLPLAGAPSIYAQNARNALGHVHFAQGHLPAALAVWTENLRLAADDPDSVDNAITAQANVAQTLQRMGNPRAAEKHWREVLRRSQGNSPADGPRVQTFKFQLASCLLDLGRPQEAAALLAPLQLEALKQGLYSELWESEMLYAQGRVALQTGRPSQALPMFEKAVALLVTPTRADPDSATLGPALQEAIGKTRALLAHAAR